MIFSVPADAGFTPKGSCEGEFDYDYDYDYDYTRGTAYETKGKVITLSFVSISIMRHRK